RERTESPGQWEAHGGAARPRPARAGIRAPRAARQEVTLGRLVLAWLPVAVVFIVIGGLGTRFYSASGAEPTNQWTRPEKVLMFTKWGILWRSLEAAAGTLFASLWFGWLGHGGWCLLLSLLGLLVSF